MRGQRFATVVIGKGDPAPSVGRGGSRILTSIMKGENPETWQGMKALMHVTLPPLGPFSPAFHFAPLVALLEGVIEVNRLHIRQSLNRAASGAGQPIPPLYASGVVYREDPFGQENWGDVLYCLQCGFFDCDRAVLWRCAEAREAGVWAKPVIKWQHLTRAMAISVGYPADEVDPDGVWLVHCCVEWPASYAVAPEAHPLLRAWQDTVLRRPSADLIEDPSKELGMGGEFTTHA